ncbi:hypothetical protein E3P89_03159 [Wallemia ichthyophaga]|uniref:Uncharacterized protein n=1 Tax=Wallemia ichthyophaga TaxID=245174 RepID=A0A4T0H2V1_WALIC|nr:hypothetical protein E3P93_03149 [Wallemia ichthyophaga]TIB09672.1 hypothetical protein E3P90_03180 [Wallemia ichthyophaga]TIB20484.1 hypothetical protein E3P89_03159 [Wallemia ichthyophaga]
MGVFPDVNVFTPTDNTLSDARHTQHSAKSTIRSHRQSRSVVAFVAAVKQRRREDSDDVVIMHRQLCALIGRVKQTQQANREVHSQITIKRNNIASRRRNLDKVADIVPYNTPSPTTHSSAALSDLQASRRVLASECLNIFGLQGLSSGGTELGGVLVPPLNRLHGMYMIARRHTTLTHHTALPHTHLIYTTAILTQLLHHLSNYLSLPLPYNSVRVYTFQPTLLLSESRRVFMCDHAHNHNHTQSHTYNQHPHSIPSIHALSMLICNLTFLLKVVGFPIELSNVAFAVNMLSRLGESPHLGATSFGDSCVNPLTHLTLPVTLSAIKDILYGSKSIKSGKSSSSSSSNESNNSEDQWEVVD